jgi:hypothetical protein
MLAAIYQQKDQNQSFPQQALLLGVFESAVCLGKLMVSKGWADQAFHGSISII